MLLRQQVCCYVYRSVLERECYGWERAKVLRNELIKAQKADGTAWLHAPKFVSV
jgi:hypothetical protein